MFGGNQITSSWGQPQQNQQQPQQGTSAFGQPAASGFGTGAFGSGGAFGQQQQPQQQPQQPQANPMFGGLGGQTNPTQPANTGFGAFGQTNPPNQGAGLFGGTKPSTGFGAFGGGGGTAGTSTFGGGNSAFGGGASTSTGTGLFGTQNSTGTSTFGSGFGQAKPATTGFGTTATTSTANPANQYDGVAPVTTGTSTPTYAAYSEREPNSSVQLQYQSITCMPAYRGCSFDELRWQDYQQGRKTAGAFGQSTFGAPAAQPSTGTGMFGQPSAPTTTQPTGSVFGGFGNNNTSTAGTNTTGAFGAFGQPAAGTSTTTGGGLFGTGAFGQQQQPQQQQPQQQQQQQQQQGGFGAFGQQQPQQPQNPPGLFGGGAFGTQANQPKPFGAFGNTNTTGTSNAFGAFGQSNPNQPANTTGTGAFGQSQPQPLNTGFGAFGQNNQPKPTGFGQQPQPNTNAFGAFGATNQAQPNQAGTQPTGGLFGNTGTAGGGLFGNNQQNQTGQQQPVTGGLFGNQTSQPAPGLFGNTNPTNTGGGLFGNNPTQQNALQPTTAGFGGGLFGQPKPANPTPANTGGGLFGGFGQQNAGLGGQTQQQQGGLFGLGQTTAPSTNNTFGLFNKPAGTTGTQLATQPVSGGFGGNIFGSTLGTSAAPLGQTVAQQQTLTASIAQPIGANLPIFNILPPGPRAISLDQPKKKSGLFLELPTRSPVPRIQLSYTPATSKLRGFTSTATIPGQGFGASLTNGKAGALSLSKAANQKSLLGPDAILNGGGPTPGLGSGGRQSVKKLILDRKVQPSDLFRKSTQPKVSFNPALGIAAREAEAAAAAAASQRVDAPPKNAAKNKFSAQTSNESVAKDGEKAPEIGELKEGDYYVRPSLADLKKRSFGELASTENLVVGRVGYGEIQFLEPVDLTGLRKTTELLGQVVRFDDKECSIYPELEETDKPTRGSGLNVSARIMLVNCWALDKATREPIKDEKHPMAVKHLKRLKNMKKTHFESFDVDEGKWVFTVDQF